VQWNWGNEFSSTGTVHTALVTKSFNQTCRDRKRKTLHHSNAILYHAKKKKVLIMTLTVFEIVTNNSMTLSMTWCKRKLIQALKQHQVTFPLRSPYRLETELSIIAVVNNLAYRILLLHTRTCSLFIQHRLWNHDDNSKATPATKYLTCSCSREGN